MAPRPKSTTSNAAATFVDGAKEMRKTLKALGDRNLLRELGAENQRIADMIVAEARARAGQGRERRVANALMAVKSSTHVSVRLTQMIDVNDKRGLRPVGTGTEFGAYKNRRRLVKNTGGRHTIVRDEEDLAKVIRRVESQTRAGHDTVRKKARTMKDWNAVQVKVIKVIKGWNGFKDWKGNDRTAGYFLFPAIRANRELAIDLYMRKIEDIWSRRTAA